MRLYVNAEWTYPDDVILGKNWENGNGTDITVKQYSVSHGANCRKYSFCLPGMKFGYRFYNMEDTILRNVRINTLNPHKCIVESETEPDVKNQMYLLLFPPPTIRSDYYVLQEEAHKIYVERKIRSIIEERTGSYFVYTYLVRVYLDSNVENDSLDVYYLGDEKYNTNTHRFHITRDKDEMLIVTEDDGLHYPRPDSAAARLQL